MEGAVYEESKLVVEGEIGSSYGHMAEGLELQLVKRKRVKGNHVSSVQSGIDASEGEIGGGSGIHQVKVKHKKIKKKKSAPRVQSGIGSSDGQMGEGLELQLVKQKRVQENHVSGIPGGLVSEGVMKHCRVANNRAKKCGRRMQKGLTASKGQRSGRSNVKQSILKEPWMYRGRTIVSVELDYAKLALEFYEKRQDTEFEILEVLFANRAFLTVPGFKGIKRWCHVSFIAKSRNSDCCEKRFFGEMVFDGVADNYKVTYCSIFDPADPRNMNGCVFCPQKEIFLHPPNGCPAGGRKIDKFMMQRGMEASQGQMGGCSKRHWEYPWTFIDSDAEEIFLKAKESRKLKYAKKALDFFEKSKGAEFEVVDVLSLACEPLVVPGSKSIEEWCHVTFIAKPRNDDCRDFTPKHFFGELLRDATTGNYNATYCEIFKPSNRELTHGCVLCPPLRKHPFKGYRVGRPPYSILEVDLD